MEQLDCVLTFFEGGLLFHQFERFLVTSFQAQVDSPTAGFLHQPGYLLVNSGYPGKAAPFHLLAGHPPAKLLEIGKIKSEVIVGDPEAVIA